VLGVGMSITISGFLIDYFLATGSSSPFTLSLLIFTILSFASVPAFYFAVKYHKRETTF
jgi:ABC-type thiamin/hydroxymethylpyrimidine transport system permease subunit